MNKGVLCLVMLAFMSVELYAQYPEQSMVCDQKIARLDSIITKISRHSDWVARLAIFKAARAVLMMEKTIYILWQSGVISEELANNLARTNSQEIYQTQHPRDVEMVDRLMSGVLDPFSEEVREWVFERAIQQL